MLLYGPVSLVAGNVRLRVDRRTAALLAYLALEGPAPRARLAGLLWPDSAGSSARANLRQLLLRLRRATQAELVVGGDVLAISTALDTGGPNALLGLGRPLDGVELDDVGELAEWLERTRRSLAERRLAALLRAHEEREAAGDLDGSLGAAREALELDPYSEEAHRRIIRTHVLRGDRTAALASLEACREMLEREFGEPPSAETRALVARLGSACGEPLRTATSHVALAVLRPPVFVGREREWALMEEAWACGQGVILCGPPGSGKTRLMQEFLAAHEGGALTFGARHGDDAAPYGTHARTYRELLAAIAPAQLPRWARRELARIVPELGPAPPPMRDAADKLRFFQAKLEAHRLAHARGFRAFGFDDLQFVDPASAEAGHYIVSQLQADPASRVRTVHCYTAGTLANELQARLREAGSGRQFALVQLEPLADADIERLLRSLGIEAIDRAAGLVARLANGSPGAAVLAAKQLLETGRLDPGRLAAARLELLSPLATQLARVLALLGTHFDFELAGRILERDPLELEPAWRELEAAQLVRGARFSDGAVGKLVVARTPEPVRAWMSRRAETAQQRAVPAA